MNTLYSAVELKYNKRIKKGLYYMLEKDIDIQVNANRLMRIRVEWSSDNDE